VDSHSWCIDIDKAEAAITAKTKAIIPVHLYGCIANMDEIKKLATRKNLFVIEDASHVHGSEYNGEKVGTLGNIGSFSLQMSKILTCGEGGILLTKDEALWQRLDALRNCGRKRDNFIVDATGGLYGEEGDFIQSGNYRITEFQAAVLLGQLSRLDEQNRIRENNASLLDELLRSLPGLRTMQRDDRETKRSFFNYSFMYDEKEVGIPTSVMREALSAELGLPFGPSYQPLNNCSLYRPLTKKRHSISIEYFKKINPLKYELPVCEDIYTNTSVVFHHKYLLGPSDDMYMIKEAYQKIIDHKKELLSFTKKE
ncbi:MAG: L-glutamine:2-deoxy-scyllo-inosose aminotransferase, partial [Spirochaetia bacterium]|nr:L-glutamine:2-deoxy-scyllo-inosose aminotransferase [Spirochaetia bacterium]